MKILGLLCIIQLALPSLAIADLPGQIAHQAEAARKILDTYHLGNQEEDANRRKLHLVYWTPSDREPAAEYHERLTRVMRHIQGFYANEMQRIGFGRRSIALVDGTDGGLKFHFVKGASPYADYGKQDGNRIRAECLPVLRAAKINPRTETILIFCNMGDWDAKARKMSHRSPYYAGGSNRGGTAWQLDEPILDTENLTDRKMMRDGEYGRISMGKHNSIFIGGVAHELGHALGLPHNKQRADEASLFGTALMGSGNRTYADELRAEGKGSFLTMAHALRLASHPQFSGSTRGMSQQAVAAFSGLELKPKKGGFNVAGNVRSEVPVYALVAYTDPDGGGDYNATTQTAVPDENGDFSMDCFDLVNGKPGELRLIACHANGATSRKAFGYSVSRNGEVDVSSATTRLALAPLVDAIQRKEATRTGEILASLPEDAKSIARRLIASNRDRSSLPTPDRVDLTRDSIPLSDTKASGAEVGWLKPSYDRLPDEGLLLSSGGQLFHHGIYAHAPARHTYELNDGWKYLEGKVGVADGHGGSVVFVVVVDGQERWRSELAEQGRPKTFRVNLDSAQQIELVVENAGDGNGADWGVWLEPTLKR